MPSRAIPEFLLVVREDDWRTTTSSFNALAGHEPTSTVHQRVRLRQQAAEARCPSRAMSRFQRTAKDGSYVFLGVFQCPRGPYIDSYENNTSEIAPVLIIPFQCPCGPYIASNAKGWRDYAGFQCPSGLWIDSNRWTRPPTDRTTACRFNALAGHDPTWTVRRRVRLRQQRAEARCPFGP